MILTKRNFNAAIDSGIPEPEQISLWPEGFPGQEIYDGITEEIVERGSTIKNRSVKKVCEPALICYPAATSENCGKAVLICPGGGYTGLAIDHEGHAVARFLNSLGISAFILKYRDPAPREQYGTFPDGPLQDGLRAMRLVRSWAEKYGYAKDKIGVMGFSAGGHLCCCISTMYNRHGDPSPALKDISARPDFSIPIYPVVTVIETFSHGDSCRRLIGDGCSFEKKQFYSPECFINSSTPPAFLVHAADDAAVPCQNSIKYFQTLTSRGIPAELHIFAKGSHGFGMKYTDSEQPAAYWIDLLTNWLKGI